MYLPRMAATTSMSRTCNTSLVRMDSPSCSSIFVADQGISPLDHSDSHDVVRLSSPAYSVHSDGEYCGQTFTESASSLDGSSRPGSDRFHLGGEFSSFDSDTIVSCTSDSDELQKPNSEPLAKLKKLFDSPGARRKQSVIILTDSSDEETTPSKLNLTSPSKHLSNVRQNSPLIVQIPLQSVKLSNSPQNLSSTLSKAKRPPAKLALSHFATSRKKMRLSSSGEDLGGDVARSPLSLKLKKSALSNLWHPVIPLTNNLTSHSNEQQPSSKSADVSGTTESNSPSSSNSLKQPEKVCEKKSGETKSAGETKSGESEVFSEGPAVVTSGSQVSNEQVSSTDITSDIFLSSTDEFMEEDSWSSYSQSTTTSTSDSILFNHSKKTHKSYTKSAMTKINSKGVNHSFSFAKVFDSHLPKLTLVNGELHPAKSMSLKTLWAVPVNHPVHSWTVGRPVATKPRRRQKNRHVKKRK